MNQGRIWCVVHPTVGLPLLLGSVALTSLAVHTAVMTHTTWMSNYWQGSHPAKVADATGKAVLQNGTALSMTVTPVPGSGATPASFVITVTPAAANPTTAASVTTVAPLKPALTKTASAD
jgi:light-harvesting protein B-800-850 alpha chain